MKTDEPLSTMAGLDIDTITMRTIPISAMASPIGSGAKGNGGEGMISVGTITGTVAGSPHCSRSSCMFLPTTQGTAIEKEATWVRNGSGGAGGGSYGEPADNFDKPELPVKFVGVTASGTPARDMGMPRQPGVV